MDNTVRALADLSAIDDQLAVEGLVPRLQARRAALREAIPDVFLAAYDVLDRARRRPVVVAVRRAHCSGCYLRLPPQLDVSVRRRQSLSICPHCGRLLFAPLPAGEGAAASDASQGSGERPSRDVAGSKPARRQPAPRLARRPTRTRARAATSRRSRAESKSGNATPAEL